MPTSRDRNSPESPRWARLSAYLREGKPYVAPVRAEWDEGEYEGTCYGIRNFVLGRYEWAYNPIPPGRLTDYTDWGTGSPSSTL